jgi:hypothetical protein
MHVDRANHSATLLLNEKVLIEGGDDSSAELYDPATGTFAITGSMNKPRGSHTATLLKSGEVLVAGGAIATGPVTTNTAELYDPAIGTFTLTASMSTPRQQHSATMLNDGRVLVAGGYNGTSDLPTAELFVPPFKSDILSFFDSSVEAGPLSP